MAIASADLCECLDQQAPEETLVNPGWHGRSSNVSTVRRCVGVGPQPLTLTGVGPVLLHALSLLLKLGTG